MKRCLTLPLALLSLACSGGDGIGPGNLTRIILDFCPGAVPIWGAYQNAGGAWTRLSGLASGHVEFDATERFAYALVFQNEDGVSTDVLSAAASDFTDRPAPVCPSQVTKTVSGSVTGLPAGQLARVTMGTKGVSTAGNFTLAEVPDGALDLIASRRMPGTVTESASDRIVIRRALNPLNGAVQPAIDFSSAEAHDVATTTLTLEGLQGGETGSISFALLSANRTFHPMGTRFTLAASQPMYSAPSALLVAADYHLIDAQVTAASGARGRGVARYYYAPANQSLAFGPAMSEVFIQNNLDVPNLRHRFMLDSQSEYSNQVSVQLVQDTRFMSVTALASHFGGTPETWTVDVPDFTGVDGWQSAWSLQSGIATDVFVVVFGPPPVRVGSVPVDGSTLRTAWFFGNM